uniref:Uncharacterized protein n=1 Tax=viral metagenome TaxID=1070528 RepID=A0A6C0DA51_9ZZZZ
MSILMHIIMFRMLLKKEHAQLKENQLQNK